MGPSTSLAPVPEAYTTSAVHFSCSRSPVPAGSGLTVMYGLPHEALRCWSVSTHVCQLGTLCMKQHNVVASVLLFGMSTRYIVYVILT